MYTENERTEQRAEGVLESLEDSSEKNLQWLLDIDLDEPEEKLFSLAQNDVADTELTANEAEVAARPMFRGKAGADDLDTYVGEEIVISSGGQASDIYTNQAEDEVDAEGANSNAMMAVDFASSASLGVAAGSADVDGMDILGLTDDDDIGEQNLVLRRIDTVSSEAVAQSVPDDSSVVEPSESQQVAAQLPPVTDESIAQPGAPVSFDQSELDILDQSPEGFLSGDLEVELPQSQLEFDDSDLDLGDILAEAADLADLGQLSAGDVVGEEIAIEELAIEELATEELATEDFAADKVFGVEGGIERREATSDTAITPAVSLVVEELLELVGNALQHQGKSADSVRVEVMLGSEPASVEAWLAEGYEPLLSVCEQPLAGLQEMRQTDVDEIFVRLVDVESGDNVNSLMAPDTSVDHDESLGTIQRVAEELADLDLGTDTPESADIIQVEFDTVSPEEAAANNVFGEDIFADDLSIELPQAGSVDSSDIDALFDSLEQPAQAEGESAGAAGAFELSSTVATGQASSGESADSSMAVHTDQQPAEEAQNEQVEPVLLDAAVELNSAVDPSVQGMSWCIPQGIDFNFTSQSGAEIFADFLDAFVDEGSAELEKLEDAVGDWEQNVSAQTAMATVTRTLHTLKGIAKGVGLQRYGTLIHNFETLLEALPKPDAETDQDYFKIVNAWLDAAVRGLDFVREHRADIASELPYQAEMESGDTAATESADVPAAEVVAAVDLESEDVRSERRELDKKLADEGAKVLAAQQSVRITSEKLDHLLNLANQTQQLGVRTAQGAALGKRASSELQKRVSSVRTQIVEITERSLINVTSRGRHGDQELDALEMDQYSELQEAANILREGIEDLADLVDVATRQNVHVEALLKQQAGVISSLGSSIQAARVVPVSRLMPGLRRIIRTVGADLNKSVSFKVQNEVGSLERDDYARCQTILEHMVRNALDHGIESPDQRMAAGKETTGQITVDVKKSGADYIVTLADDGKGIDPAVLRESVRSKGLDIDVDGLTDDDALRLIFHKGFSTARELSQVSGRGVGMDIVLTELQQMGGDIQISSEVGRGTTFTIRIPANVTVNGALLVTAAESSYAIPLGGLVAVEHVAVAEFFAAVESGSTLSLSGMECEPAYLATLCSGASLPDPAELGVSLPVMIAGTGPRYMAIAIDDVEEALELVIRHIGPQFSSVPGVAGAATTASGQAVVALDLNLLAESAARAGGSSVAVDEAREESLLAMVVDDSRTQRMVTTSQLDTLGVDSFTAENGQVAIDLLDSAERLPDIILMDVEMPLKDGIQALREIRKSHRYGHIPIIMITSRTGLKHRSLAEEAGCNGYMGKPFNFRMLVAQINELTGHNLQLS